jgi:hypothetical protein
MEEHMQTTTSVLGVALLIGLAVCLMAPGLPAQPPQPPAPPAGLDLASVVDIGEYYVKPVQQQRDAKTGFIVGGRNTTAVIQRLPSINGRTVADLEKDMRPGAKSDVASEKGFLGPDEKLLDVLAMDNRTVVEELGLTHQELARHLHNLAAIGFWQQKHNREGGEFVYHGRRFKVVVLTTKGTQPSPFKDGTTSGSDATVENLETGKKLEYALLVPMMIERYGFYEGKGTPWRVDPKQVVEVLDFIKPKGKK